ncbi:HTH domain-containing protein [Cutibacterium acnes]
MLSEAKEPLHYSEIAQRILDSGLRQQTGATPAATVAATISTTLRKNVVRVDRGVYSLRTPQSVPPEESETELPDSRGVIPPTALEAGEENNGFLNAFGMFWRRDEVDWDKRGQTLLGAQLKVAKPVNFSGQVGVYILYSGERVICVGRITEPRLGPRLWDHTRDRLAGRWDRFSWFGVLIAKDDGTLGDVPCGNFAVDMLVSTMVALLIEGLEPPQNRRRGDGFNATEFIQATDPEVERRRAKQLLFKLTDSK